MTVATLYHNGSTHCVTKLGPLMLQQSPHTLPSVNSEIGRTAIVVIRPSALRLGLIARICGAGCLVAGIWALIGWVLLQ